VKRRDEKTRQGGKITQLKGEKKYIYKGDGAFT
jgi:hypothetical protein